MHSIYAGDLILEEAPLLSFDGDWSDAKDLQALNAKFEALPADKQAAVMALDDAFTGRGGKNFPGRSSKRQKTLPGILQTNAFVGDRGEGLLCAAASRFNHSCRPNCEHSWDEEAGVLRIFASTDILHGEDLTVSYIDLWAQTRERRQLTRQFGFTCMCPLCLSETTPNSHGEPGSEIRRQRLAEMIEATEDVAEKDPRQGLELIQKTMAMIDRERLFLNSFRSQACFYASKLSARLGEDEVAKQWAELAYGYCVMSHGDRHRETRRLEAHLADL